jgi:hypothetical protein
VVLVTRLAMVDAGVAAPLRLLGAVVIGAVVYCGLLLWREPELLRDVRGIVARRLAASVAPVAVEA